MSIKTDRPQVRTAQDLERKYDFSSFANVSKNVKQTEEGLNRVQNELYSFLRATIGDLDTLEKQLDGQIQTYYGYETPTLSNLPASEWSTEDYEEHINDLYYDKNSGSTFKFVFANEEYMWQEISNSFLSEVLAIANSASDTADNKKRVFISQPIPPYDNGDLWLNNKKIYVCQLSRETGDEYDPQDFIEATDYTDDTLAKANQESIEVLDGKVTRLIAENNEFTLEFETQRTLIDDNTQKILEWVNYIRFVDGNIELGKAENKFTLKIENDKIVIFYNGAPFSYWIRDEFTVSRINIGNLDENGNLKNGFAFVPRSNGSLGFRKVA